MNPLKRIIRNRIDLSRRESLLTPVEWRELLRTDPLASTFALSGDVLQLGLLANYTREGRGNDFILFRREQQEGTLLVCFSDLYRSFFYPVPAFLQLVAPTGFDVLVLHDSQRDWHLDGIAGLSTDLEGTLRVVQTLAAERGYRRIVCFGSSMGGHPAIRAGARLGAAHTVSVGGTPVNPLHYHVRTGKFSPAFDHLCACRAPNAAPPHLYFCKTAFLDLRFAEQTRALWPGTLITPVPSRKHDIFASLPGRNAQQNLLLAMLTAPETVDIGHGLGGQSGD